MRRGQPEERLPRTRPRRQRRRHPLTHTQAQARQLLPGGPARSLLAGGRGRNRRGVRDGDERRINEEGREGGRADGDRPHGLEPGVEDLRDAGRCRARRADLPRLPLRAPSAPPRQQRAGAGQSRAQEEEPRGACLPLKEIVDPHDGRGLLRDG